MKTEEVLEKARNLTGERAWEICVTLSSTEDISIAELARRLGKDNSTLHQWKNGQKPSTDSAIDLLTYAAKLKVKV